MGRLNWSIFDGAEFESLVHTLLFFTVPDIVLFGRPGKDSGQDAISGDGTHVYQAKYGRTLSEDDAIARAKEELDNIRKHLKPDDADYRFWEKVKHWTLVANFEKNPWTNEKWQKEIVEGYADLGLVLDSRDATDLEALLTNYPDIERAFFHGKNRLFLGLWEARRSLEQRSVADNYFGAELHGREEQIQRVDGFAADPEQRFLVVHGQTETGKSRFLYEAAVRLSQQGWRVFWGLPESMSRSDAWMQGITGATSKTCLVIDDPKDVTLVNSVFEQLSTDEKSAWKAIVSCSPHEFNDWFGDKQLQRNTRHIELGSLPDMPAKEMIKELAKSSAINLSDNAVEQIFSLSRGLPGWISLLLGYSRERGKGLQLYPELLQAVSVQVRKAMSMWDDASRTRRQGILRWICAWKTIVFEGGSDGQNPAISFLSTEFNESPEQLHDDLQSLVDNGLLVKWGYNRTHYTAEPILVRHHVLCEWLLEKDDNAYRIAGGGRNFIQRLVESEIPGKEAIVENLAALSSCYLGHEQCVDFFKPIANELTNWVEKESPTRQLAVFDWAKRISSVDPEAALDIIQKILDNLGQSTNTPHQCPASLKDVHAQIMQQVAWFLYSRARLFRTRPLSVRLWTAFRRIHQEEIAGGFKPLPGQTAEELILRLLLELDGHEQFRVLAHEELSDDCARKKFDSFDTVLAKGLLSPRRESVESFKWQVTFRHGYILPGSPDWNRAAHTREMLFALVEQNAIPAANLALWRVLAGAHDGWSMPWGMDESTARELGVHYQPIAIDDLRRTLTILKQRGSNIRIPELVAARRLWKNALQQEMPKEESELAKACEEEFQKHFMWNYPALFTWDANDDVLAGMLLEIKGHLASATHSQSIVAFFEEASEFLRAQDPDQPDTDFGRAYDLAFACWDLYSAQSGNAFSGFVDECITKPRGNNVFMWIFFVFFLRIWIREYKSQNPGSNVVEEIKRLLATSDGKEELLSWVYGGVSSQEIGRATSQEMDYVCSKECKFNNEQLAGILPTFLRVDSSAVLQRFKQILDEERGLGHRVERIWGAFVRNNHLIVLKERGRTVPTPIEWLMLAVREYGISGNCFERSDFRLLAQSCGYKMSQKEFADFMESRIELEQNGQTSSDFIIMPYHFDVARWVSTETDSTAIGRLCRLSVEDRGYWTRGEIPAYIAVLDNGGETVCTFIGNDLSTESDIEPTKLQRLGHLASEYAEDSDAWKKIITVICRYMNEKGISREERKSVYHSFHPCLQTWSAAPGKVPPKMIEREVATRKAMEATSPDSDLYEYRVWAHEYAERERKLEQESVEKERHE